MCGILGIIGNKKVDSILLDGLKRLEYRGYDSSGIATLENGKIHCTRAQGKIHNLEAQIANSNHTGTLGIAHTRWATHGEPTKKNAHPHKTSKVAVVHNGIIENFLSLKDELIAKNHVFNSDTDTEVIPLLIHDYMEQGFNEKEATKKTIDRLEGAFSIAVIFADSNDLLIGARKGAPLAIGFGDGEMFLGSDSYALAPLTNKISYLDDGDWVVLTRDNFEIFDKDNKAVKREIKNTEISGALIGKGNFPHFMLKEIYEQPSVLGETLNSYINIADKKIYIDEVNDFAKDLKRIQIVACGTSLYAGMIAKYWLESYAKIPVDIECASEYRYRDIIYDENLLCVFISQSGETADTLAALKKAKENNQKILSIVNVKESSIGNLSDIVLQTLAGPEIGVASTKAFTTQIAVLAAFTIKLATEKNAISEKQRFELIYQLMEAPGRIVEVLNRHDEIKTLANKLKSYSNIIYTGRNVNFVIALESALKLKELSYIHSEAIAAGEFKHGTIALIDENLPVIILAPHDKLFEKTFSNAQELASRSGKLFSITDKKGKESLATISDTVFEMPNLPDFITPLIYVIPCQLLAYEIAHKLGKDIDQPRNLAKSVTVE